jgi:hypothetical protein
MRILARTLIILAAAAAVAGGLFAVAQSSYTQTLFPAGPARSALAEGQPPANAQAAGSLPPRDGADFGRPNHEGGRSPSLFGAVEVVKNLAIISIIVAIVSLMRRPWRGRRPTTPPASTPSI